jgi:Rrf2 family transcriptional regulator, iron-sulfur cluster assembly transcription factor
MILGTKARYAVMSLVDLVTCCNGRPVALADIASRQEISLAYLEQIFPKLKRAGLVKPVRGPGGGYLLAKPSDETFIIEIVEAVDESLQMTRCNSFKDKSGCMSNRSSCATHHLWQGLGDQIATYLSSISLQDVCDRNVAKMLVGQETKESNRQACASETAAHP